MNAVEVMVDGPRADRRLPARARAAPVGADARLVDWQQLNSHFFAALQVERNVMFLILTLIILVAAFNIITGITMLVKSKGRDIAILRTMGATRGAILRIFFLSGASIGVVGTLLGLPAGPRLRAQHRHHPPRPGEPDRRRAVVGRDPLPLRSCRPRSRPATCCSVVAMGLVLSFLATIYPAWRAARLDPVEALRYE